jgi:hypothetical protein
LFRFDWRRFDLLHQRGHFRLDRYRFDQHWLNFLCCLSRGRLEWCRLVLLRFALLRLDLLRGLAPCVCSASSRDRVAAVTTSTVHLPSRTGWRLRVQAARGEVVAHLLVGDPDEPGVIENVLDLVGGGVAANVLFLHHIPQVLPLADAVADVLEELPLPLGASPIAEEDPVQRALLFLLHASSFRARFPANPSAGHERIRGS